MSFLNILPRRTPKPAPGRHTAASIARLPMPGTPTGDMHITAPAPENATLAVRSGPRFTWPETPRPAETPEMTEALAPLREKLGEVPPLPEGPAAIDVLRKTRDALLTLPPLHYASIRAVARDGSEGKDLESITGLPFLAGTRDNDGRRVAGVCYGEADGDIWLVFESGSPEVHDAAIAAHQAARDLLVHGTSRDGQDAAPGDDGEGQAA